MDEMTDRIYELQGSDFTLFEAAAKLCDQETEDEMHGIIVSILAGDICNRIGLIDVVKQVRQPGTGAYLFSRKRTHRSK